MAHLSASRLFQGAVTTVVPGAEIAGRSQLNLKGSVRTGDHSIEVPGVVDQHKGSVVYCLGSGVRFRSGQSGGSGD